MSIFEYNEEKELELFSDRRSLPPESSRAWNGESEPWLRPAKK